MCHLPTPSFLRAYVAYFLTCLRGLLRRKPADRLLAVHEPLRGENGRSFDRLLPRLRRSGGHYERELAHAGRAVARDDVGIPPFHDAAPELVAKLDGVDEEAARPRLLRLPGEQAQRGHETTIGHAHGRRQPSEFHDRLGGMVSNDAPRVGGELLGHVSPPTSPGQADTGRGRRYGTWYTKSSRHIFVTEYMLDICQSRIRSSAWRRSWASSPANGSRRSSTR